MFGHSGEKQHTCVVCMLIHTGERPAKCSVYYKQFTTHGSLSTCMYTHTGEQSHECDVCLKRFIERGSLNAHMLLHTSEKVCAASSLTAQHTPMCTHELKTTTGVFCAK